MNLSFLNKYVLVIAFVLMCSNLFAAKVIDAIATKAGGYDIPIKIMLPDNATEKSPVFFFVHGGGWNGGTETAVPKASVPNDASYLCDRMGIIYVGLAYRCKGNKGTFALAIEDLEASITWFLSRANEYNADVSRIGFGGGSAGTTLSAILAQRTPNCKLYVGSEGMYNIVDQVEDLSFFPTKEGKELYGLNTEEQRLAASPFYHIRNKPATALLFHGKDDFLCHPSQSKKYAKQLRKAGGKAIVVLYDTINHTCVNPGYPEVFRNSILEISRLYAAEFQLKNVDFKSIETDLEKRLKGQYPSTAVQDEQLIGAWKNRNQSFVFEKNGMGYALNKNGQQTHQFSYENTGSEIFILEAENKRIFYLRKNNNTIYELIQDESRLNSRRIDYKKQN